MKTNEEARTIVERYFRALTTQDVDSAFSLLADDLEFRGPGATYHGAEAFRPGLVGFAAMTSGARVVDLLVDGNRVAMLYDCDLPDPVGTLMIASFFRVEGGKIRTYETQFDATELSTLARTSEAARAYRAALRLVVHPAEKRFLERRLADCEPPA